MKKSLIGRFATFGTALLLSTFAVFPAFASNICGHLDTVSAYEITGWAWDADAPDTALSIELSITNITNMDTNTETKNTEAAADGNTSGSAAVTTVLVPAQNPREDLQTALGSANHGYAYTIDWSQIAGETFTITAAALSGETKIPLIGSLTYTKEAMSVTAIESQEVPAPVTEAVSTETASADTAVQTGSSSSTGFLEKDTSGPGAPTPVAATAEPGAYLGKFTASGYCSCIKCSGGYSKTYSGTTPKANHTIAADLNYYPIGTKLMINGIVYTVEDRGSNVYDNRLDIYFASHAEALAFGLQKVDVYAAK